MTDHQRKIYIVASYNHTLAGNLIRARAKLKFWNRYAGDGYSHISLSLDPRLDHMMSFARRNLHNPLVAGLVQEDIRSGVFGLRPEKSRIAVFALPASEEQYRRVQARMEAHWRRREELKYNFLGLFTMLLWARGAARPDHYFCSQWVSEVLQQCGLDLFQGRRAYHIRPFDFYCALRDRIIYEGAAADYPLYSGGEEDTHAGTHDPSDFLPAAESPAE